VASRVDSPLFTIGHGAVDSETFVRFLRDAAIVSLVDVRRFPGSRKHPQFGSAALAQALGDNGIAYRHAEHLGGRRRPKADSPNAGLRNEGFRGYADWMAGDAFRAAFAEVVEEAQKRRTAVMCAETPWWKCHRRLIADATVLLAKAPVVHLISGKRADHRLTDGVTVAEDRILYI